jgi:hypothetical protein
LVEYKPFSAVTHPFHDFFLSVELLVWSLFVEMAFKVVLVVWLPWFRAHIAKGSAACTFHKVAAH